MTHIAVLGAGITGITTAYALLERGFEVTVLDRNRYAAMDTSFANGGQLSASNAEVWNSWRTVLKGMRWMFRPDAPLLMNPFPGWHKYSWMAEFVAAIPKHRQNTIATTRLAIAAREHLFRIAEREGIDFHHERRGILHIYYDAHSFADAGRINALLQEGGLERFPVSREEMLEIEPALTGKFHAGYFTPSDSTGDIHKFTRGLAEACLRRGARLVQDAEILSARPRAGGGALVQWRSLAAEPPSNQIETLSADAVVVCAGVGSRALAHQLGDRVNIYPVKGYSITVTVENGDDRTAAPWVSLLDEEAKVVTSRLGENRLRVAGTAEFNGLNRDIRFDRIQPLVAWTRRLFPRIETSQVLPWAGLRPMMPDMMPKVGPGKHPGVFYNTGHGHLGWTLSAATAEMVADAVSSAFPADAVAPIAA